MLGPNPNPFLFSLSVPSLTFAQCVAEIFTERSKRSAEKGALQRRFFSGVAPAQIPLFSTGYSSHVTREERLTVQRQTCLAPLSLRPKG